MVTVFRILTTGATLFTCCVSDCMAQQASPNPSATPSPTSAPSNTSPQGGTHLDGTVTPGPNIGNTGPVDARQTPGTSMREGAQPGQSGSFEAVQQTGVAPQGGTG